MHLTSMFWGSSQSITQIATSTSFLVVSSISQLLGPMRGWAGTDGGHWGSDVSGCGA